MTQIPIIYMNLPARADRRRYMDEQFKRLGLSASRIESVTPNHLDSDDVARYCNASRYPSKTPQELACSLSHVAAWRAFLGTTASRALILEDDVILSDRLPGFLAKLPDLAHDIIRIETATRGVDSDRWKLLTSEPIATLAGNIALRRFRSTARGSAAYIISRRGAETALSAANLLKLPHDVALFDPLERPSRDLDIVQSDPALAIQLGNTAAYAKHAFAVSDNASAPGRKSLSLLFGHMGRELHHGLIKGAELITRRDLKRREIAFSGKTEFVDVYLSRQKS